MTHSSANVASPATSTSDLFQACNTALMAGRWSEARALLDDLGQRRDNPYTLLSVSTYMMLSGKSMLGGYVAVLQDRIDLVNSWAEDYQLDL